MKRIISFGAIAAGLLLAACSSAELLEPNDNGVSDIDQTLYISMAIAGDSDSRSAADDGNPIDGGDKPDFEQGTGTAGPESKIESAYFVFYDANGAPVGEIARVRPENGGVVDNNTNSIERSYSAVVPVKLHKGENKPTQVIAYINPISPAALQNPLNQVQLQTRQTVKYNANGTSYFPMSNSVHYHGTGTNAPVVAVEIPSESAFFDTREAAEEALKGNSSAVITINVERYAAKLKFEIQKDGNNPTGFNIEDFETTSETYESSMDAKEEPLKFKLRFHPDNWILNAECKDTYVVKSMRKNSQSGDILGEDYPYDLLNGRINIKDPAKGDIVTPEALTSGAWVWNNPDYHRCYWACSPAYFTNTYPEVADDYKGIASTHPQKFYTYSEIIGTNGAGYKMENNLHYAKETTVGYTALRSPNPAASIASVVIAGHYDVIKVTSTGETTITKEDATAFDGTFYTYLTTKNGTPGIYFNHYTYGANIGHSVVEGAESLLSRMVSQATILFKKDLTKADTYTRFDYGNAEDFRILSDALEIIRPTNEKIIKGLKIPSRYVTLQFKTGVNTKDNKIYLANGKGFRQIVSDDEYNELTDKNGYISWSEANIHLMQQVGYATKYHNSYTYFSIPVKHLGWYRTANTQKNEKTINWNIVRVGDFGIVRNHSYNIQVTKISGIGTGIGDPDDPIIPPTDTQDYYVAYRMNILKWAIVPQQSVEL